MSQNNSDEQAVKVAVTEGDEATEEEAVAEATEADESSEEDTAPEDTLAQRLAAAEDALKEEKDRFLRLYAEFENFRKRSAREMQDFRKFANENLIRDLLPIVDNLERAIVSATVTADGQRSILEGVEITHREILKVLERHNVTPVEALGKPFDPRHHEAVGAEESQDHPDNTVLREFQKGYLLHDRLIRPSMVIVSRAVPKPAAEPEEDSSDNASAAEEESVENNADEA